MAQNKRYNLTTRCKMLLPADLSRPCQRLNTRPYIVFPSLLTLFLHDKERYSEDVCILLLGEVTSARAHPSVDMQTMHCGSWLPLVF